MKISKSALTIVIIGVVILIAAGAIFATVMLLNNRQVGLQKNKAAVGGSIIASFDKTTVSAANSQQFSLSLRVKPTTNSSLQGFEFHLNFSNAALQVSDITYDIGNVSVGLGDDSTTLSSVNSKGSIKLVGEVRSGTGQAIPQNIDTSLFTIKFTSLGNSPSTVSLNTGLANQTIFIQSDNSLTQFNAVLQSDASINGTSTTTTTPVSTTSTTTTTPVPSTTFVTTSTTVPVTSTALGTTCTFNNKTYPVDNINLGVYVSGASNGICKQLSAGACPILYPDGSYTWNVSTNNCQKVSVSQSITTTVTTTLSPQATTSVPVTSTTSSSLTQTTSVVSTTYTTQSTTPVISTTTEPLPNTGVFDEVILPTLIGLSLIFAGGVMFISKDIKRIK